MQLLKQIRITRIETRPKDAWYDISLRQLRKGEVYFYRVRDYFTGNWLFKICSDKEEGKVLVKAVKCPAGILFAQIEGNTMVFQRSKKEGWLYDVVSLTKSDENDRLSRKMVERLDEVPAVIRESYEIEPYEQVVGKKAPGKYWVTLSKSNDTKGMIKLFLFERAWTLSATTPEEKLKTLEEQERIKPKIGKKEIDAGQTWKCQICGSEFQPKHIEIQTNIKHVLVKI